MEKLELERAYKETGTIQKTAKYFGCSYGKIRYQLNKHKISYSLEKSTKEISKFQLEKVYLETQSVREVGKHFSMSHEKARLLLNKHGLCNKPVRYNCNHNFFSKNNQWSFYWAGFLAADGCILNRNGSMLISLALSKKDKDIVLAFKKIIDAENPVKDYLVKNSKRNPKWNDSWKSEIKITSNKLCKDLERFNIVPRKTKIYTFPEWIVNHELVHHFMRGYFDGDGSFYISKLANGRVVPQIYFSLRGTPEFLTTYRLIFEYKCGFEKRNKDIRINSGIGILEYGGNGIVGQIAKFLYKDANMYMARKLDLISKHLEEI